MVDSLAADLPSGSHHRVPFGAVDRVLALASRYVVALVWLYHGSWAKLLAGRPEHAAIVARMEVACADAATYLERCAAGGDP